MPKIIRVIEYEGTATDLAEQMKKSLADGTHGDGGKGIGSRWRTTITVVTVPDEDVISYDLICLIKEFKNNDD